MHISDFLVYIIWLHTKNVLSYNSDEGIFLFWRENQLDKFVIRGGKKLCGEVDAELSKNAFLPIIAGCVLSEEEVVLRDCPHYTDIDAMLNVLKKLGAHIVWLGNDLRIKCEKLDFCYISSELTKMIRSSIFLLGALLGRMKKAKMAYPGGCEIGLRPIDMHLKAFKELGVFVEEKHGYIFCDATNYCSKTIYLDYPSVGVTENVMMCAVLNEGQTIIHNAAKEPEIEDLQNFLNSMGACVSGAGTDRIVITGVESLRGAVYRPIPDRIFCGTLLCACAITGGEVVLNCCEPKHFLSIIDKLLKSSCKIELNNDKIYLSSDGHLSSFLEIETGPYPCFPTDMQTQMLAVSTVCSGVTKITENVFESRFKVVPELNKMGANIGVYGKTAYVLGVDNLYGATVYAKDLRGAASLVVAGLRAEGYTTIEDVWHLDRGYASFEKVLQKLGADVQRI